MNNQEKREQILKQMAQIDCMARGSMTAEIEFLKVKESSTAI